MVCCALQRRSGNFHASKRIAGLESDAFAVRRNGREERGRLNLPQLLRLAGRIRVSPIDAVIWLVREKDVLAIRVPQGRGTHAAKRREAHGGVAFEVLNQRSSLAKTSPIPNTRRLPSGENCKPL